MSVHALSAPTIPIGSRTQSSAELRNTGKKMGDASIFDPASLVIAGATGVGLYYGASALTALFPPAGVMIAAGFALHGLYNYFKSTSKQKNLELELEKATTNEAKAVIEKEIGVAQSEAKWAAIGGLLSLIPGLGLGAKAAKAAKASTKGWAAIKECTTIYWKSEKIWRSSFATGAEMLGVGVCMAPQVSVSTYTPCASHKLNQKALAGIMSGQEDKINAEIAQEQTKTEGSVAMTQTEVGRQIQYAGMGPYWQNPMMGGGCYNPMGPMGYNSFGGMYGGAFGNQMNFNTRQLPAFNWATS